MNGDNKRGGIYVVTAKSGIAYDDQPIKFFEMRKVDEN
jgi:hypothetical protein